MAVMVRFEREGRGRIDYGPFPFVQLTYESLRAGPEGEEFAYLHSDDGLWRVFGPGVTVGWTDVIIWAVEV